MNSPTTATGAQPPLSTSISNADFTYALAIALAFLTTLILASYLCFRLTRHIQTLNPTSSLSSASSSVDTGVVLPRVIFVAEDEDGGGDDMQSVVGLDQRVINSYPKFPFSKSLKSDLMCPICLCEYKDAEMLRMLPECKHFFHLFCVDAWLKLSASCPVCRNSPLPTPLSEVVPLSQYTNGQNRRRVKMNLSRHSLGISNIWLMREAYMNVRLNRNLKILHLFWLLLRMELFLIFLKVQMSKEMDIMKVGKCRRTPRFFFVVGSLTVLVYIATLSKFYSLRTLVISDTFCNFNNPVRDGSAEKFMKQTLDTVIQKIKEEINNTREIPDESSHGPRFSAFLVDILGLIELVEESLPQIDTSELQNGEPEAVHPLVRRKQNSEAAEYFLIEEIRKYVRIKPNRLRKQNFMGANGTFTSIGHACFVMKKELEEYMDYDIGDICQDDWRLAQKLMVHGCDPLPRRRCLSRAPQLYTKPLPINESLWKLPDNRNVRWSQYLCKNFTCLANNFTRKGFFKCADCFNLTDHEMPRWIIPEYQDPSSNLTADFLITEVLDLNTGEIRIGLDFSIGTGTFAARMREHNVTIVSASINLGAPFNEMIALRGLIPLYLTINQRLPFFDNTLDLIHTTRFLDGWIDFVLLDFVLYDWDRVLRPGGLLWIDSFFCLKEDLNDYLESFKMLRYKKHRWVIVPKLDKDDKEVFFSAVLEKPPRPF